MDLVWVHTLADGKARPIPSTEGASCPFWSPDGSSIGFFVAGELRRISRDGGPPQTLCEVKVGRGGSWNRDGNIVFCPDFVSPLFKVSARGGKPEAVTRLEEQHQVTSHRWPWFLPDGRHFLYYAGDPGGATNEFHGIYVGSLDWEPARRVLNANSNAAYADGHLLFLRHGALMAQPFDLKRYALGGDAFQVAEQVRYEVPQMSAMFSVSENSLLVYQEGQPGYSRLKWFGRAGQDLGTVGEPALYSSPRLSPDGRWVAVEIFDHNSSKVDIWLIEVATNRAKRLTYHHSRNIVPVWSPDGERLVFTSSPLRPGVSDLCLKLTSGLGSDEIVVETHAHKFATDWSRDGQWIAFNTRELNSASKRQIAIMPVAGDRRPHTLLGADHHYRGAQFSPDGRWITYSSDESGREEVYVTTSATSDARWQVSQGGGEEPRWGPGGREIFFLAAGPQKRSTMMSALVDGSGGAFEVLRIQALFSMRPKIYMEGTAYDVTPDGERFLINIQSEEPHSYLTLTQNWTAYRNTR